MDIELKSGGQKLATTLIKPEGFKEPIPGLIFVHGWKSNRQGNDKRATEISRLGFVCLTLDLRGHGNSDGTIDQFSRKDHLDDIKSAYKYLVDLDGVNPNKIGIIGSSYGGYLSAVGSNYLEFEWLVLRVPALYYTDEKFNIPTEKLIGEDEEGDSFRFSDLTPEESLALKGVANFPGEILIVESEKDMVIPHATIENYLRLIPDKRRLTYKIMKGAAHSLETAAQEKEYINILKDWFLEKADHLEIEV